MTDQDLYRRASQPGQDTDGPGEVRHEPDTRRRKLIAAAQELWIDALTDLGGRNTLLYYKDRRAGTLDLAGADPAAPPPPPPQERPDLPARSVEPEQPAEPAQAAGPAQPAEAARAARMDGQTGTGTEQLPGATATEPGS